MDRVCVFFFPSALVRFGSLSLAAQGGFEMLLFGARGPQVEEGVYPCQAPFFGTGVVVTP